MPHVTYLSDLHLECFDTWNDKYTGWEGDGDILCLAGDIGKPNKKPYNDFIRHCSLMFKYVFVIAGNHEYYMSKTFDEVNTMINSICSQYSNVYFLNNNIHHIKEYNILILGTTLWTKTKELHPLYCKFYNDFNYIPEMTTQECMNALHEQSVLFLEKKLNSHVFSKVIVLSHHMPSFELISAKYKGNPINYLYASDLTYMFEKYKIDHWICGHSHVSNNITIQKTQIHMNPIGYPGENKVLHWSAMFEI